MCKEYRKIIFCCSECPHKMTMVEAKATYGYVVHVCWREDVNIVCTDHINYPENKWNVYTTPIPKWCPLKDAEEK